MSWAFQPLLPAAQQLANQQPTVSLSSPADAGSTSDTTPDLVFTGTDPESDDIRYQVQVATDNQFTEIVVVDSFLLPDEAGGQLNDTVKRRGQSFLGDGSTLVQATMQLSKTSSPTGSLYFQIFAHTDTFGTDGVPTGSSLATSESFDVSTLTGSFQYITLQFTGGNQIELVNTVPYFIVAYYEDGDATNVVNVSLTFSSAADGNSAVETSPGTWADSSLDIPFSVEGVGSLLIDAISGTDSGFSGSPDNTDPFTSGQAVTYTVQSALDDDTYYWRVRGIDPSGSTFYGPWSSTRSFVLTTGYTPLTAATGTFALTGNAATLTVSRALTAATGTFSLTGNNATLTKAYRLVATAGTFSLTGNTATFTVTRAIVANTGVFTLTGNTAGLSKSSVLTASTGTFSLTGHDANFARTYQITADTGSFTLSGYDATFSITRTLVASTGTFALTGNTAGLTVSRALSASSGTFALTGHDASLAYITAGGCFIIQENGDFLLQENGDKLELEVCPVSFDLTASTGTFALTGNSAGLTVARSLTASSGTFTITGSDATFSITRSLTASTGSFTLTGNPATLTVTRVLTADTGTFALAGNDASLNYVPLNTYLLVANTGVFTLTGNDAPLTYTPIVATGNIKYWDGSQWQIKQLKRWDGNAWQNATLKRWNGSVWETITY